MIYLILDTNTWIYLANGTDLTTGKIHDSAHFTLFEKLTQKVEDGSVKILINDTIIQEWTRNKRSANTLIEKHKARLRNSIDVLDDIKDKLQGIVDKEIKSVQENYKKYIDEQISLNEAHINQVERLLSSSLQFPITNEAKIFAADWAVAKKAPFIGDKSNSMADAYILFAAVEYIKNISSMNAIDEFPIYHTPIPIFVTANKNDFSSANNANAIHDDLKSLLEEVNMFYYRMLPLALNFVEAKLFEESEIERIGAEMEAQYYANIAICEICDPDEFSQMNLIHFSKPYEIDNEFEEQSHTQLNLEFEDSDPMTNSDDFFVTSIQSGECQYCNTEYIKCQGCNEITAITDDKADGFECEGCGLYYKINHRYIGSGMTEETIKIVAKPID
jgi:hypothetical protein